MIILKGITLILFIAILFFMIVGKINFINATKKNDPGKRMVAVSMMVIGRGLIPYFIISLIITLIVGIFV